MSNGINERQNEQNSITMLAAQRQLYEDVGNLDYWNFILSVVIPFIFSFVQGIGITWIQYLSYILTFIMIFLSLHFSRKCKEKKSVAAAIQLCFDTYVFNMPWDKKLFGPRKDFSSEIASYSKKIMSDPDEEKKLHNWYVSPADEMPIEKGIITCQRENYNWDVGLRKKYRLILISLLILLTIIVFLSGVISNESIKDLLCRIVFLIPMVRWLVTTENSIKEDVKRLNDMSGLFTAVGQRDMDELQDIQKALIEHRKACVKIPTVIYNKFKENDEDREHRRAEFARNESDS